jgi:hypothetical protein
VDKQVYKLFVRSLLWGMMTGCGLVVSAQSTEVPVTTLMEAVRDASEAESKATVKDTDLPTGQAPKGAIGGWPHGPCRAATADGSYAYIGTGGLIKVIDVSDPSHPTDRTYAVESIAH